MNAVLHAPWICVLVGLPLAAAVAIRVPRVRPHARRIGLWTVSITVAVSLCAWLEASAWGPGMVLADPLDPLGALGGGLWRIDALNGILLPFCALICWAIILLTPRTQRGHASLSHALLAESALLGLFASRDALPILVFYIAGLLPAWLECRRQDDGGRLSRRLFLVQAMGGGIVVGVAACAIGFASVTGNGVRADWIVLPVLVVVLSRKGIVPFHGWLPGFFEHGPFRLALLWSMPQAGVYLAVRIVLPAASSGALAWVAWLSLATAVYAAGLALVQTDARRLFGYFFMSQSALVLVGLGRMTTLGITAGLTLWLAGSVSLTGLGLVIWALEARRGRLTLGAPQGGYAQTPHLAVCFLIMGLTSVGFPGTLGFIGQELLVDAVLEQRSFASVAIMTAIVFNGITILRVYGLLFCGASSRGRHNQLMRMRERVGVLTLACLVMIAGILPQPIVRTREAAAQAILALRGGMDGEDAE